MAGKATVTTVPSRITINKPAHRTMSAGQRLLAVAAEADSATGVFAVIIRPYQIVLFGTISDGISSAGGVPVATRPSSRACPRAARRAKAAPAADPPR